MLSHRSVVGSIKYLHSRGQTCGSPILMYGTRIEQLGPIHPVRAVVNRDIFSGREYWSPIRCHMRFKAEVSFGMLCFICPWHWPKMNTNFLDVSGAPFRSIWRVRIRLASCRENGPVAKRMAS
jgi:hypothetical protein